MSSPCAIIITLSLIGLAGCAAAPRPAKDAELEATLAVARERLQRVRRAGAERTEEMLRSAGEGVERLAARIAEAMAER